MDQPSDATDRGEGPSASTSRRRSRIAEPPASSPEPVETRKIRIGRSRKPTFKAAAAAADVEDDPPDPEEHLGPPARRVSRHRPTTDGAGETGSPGDVKPETTKQSPRMVIRPPSPPIAPAPALTVTKPAEPSSGNPSAAASTSGDLEAEVDPNGNEEADHEGAEDDGPHRFKCLTTGCKKTFKNSQGLKYHQSERGRCTGHEEEDEKAYACFVPECGKRYKNRNGLKYHYESSKRAKDGVDAHGLEGLRLLAEGGHPAPLYGTLLPSARRRHKDGVPLSAPTVSASSSATASAPALDRLQGSSSSTSSGPGPFGREHRAAFYSYPPAASSHPGYPYAAGPAPPPADPQHVVVGGHLCELGYEQVPGEPEGHVRPVYRPIGPAPTHHLAPGPVMAARAREASMLSTESEGPKPKVHPPASRHGNGVDSMNVDEEEEDELEGGDESSMQIDQPHGVIAKPTASPIGKKGQRPLTLNQRNADTLKVVEAAMRHAIQVIDSSNGRTNKVFVDKVGWVDKEGPIPRGVGDGEYGSVTKRGKGRGKGQGREYAGDPNLAWKCYHSKCGKRYTAQSSLRQHYKANGHHGVLGLNLLHLRMHRRPPHNGPQPGDPACKIPIRPSVLLGLEGVSIPRVVEKTPSKTKLRTSKGPGDAKGSMGPDSSFKDAVSEASEVSAFVSDTSDEESSGEDMAMRVHEIENVLDALWKEEGGTDEGAKAADQEIDLIIGGLAPLSARRARQRKKKARRVAPLPRPSPATHHSQDRADLIRMSNQQTPPVLPLLDPSEPPPAHPQVQSPDPHAPVIDDTAAANRHEWHYRDRPGNAHRPSVAARDPSAVQLPSKKGVAPGAAYPYYQYQARPPPQMMQYPPPPWQVPPHLLPPPPPGYRYVPVNAPAPPSPQRHDQRTSLSHWSRTEVAHWQQQQHQFQQQSPYAPPTGYTSHYPPHAPYAAYPRYGHGHPPRSVEGHPRKRRKADRHGPPTVVDLTHEDELGDVTSDQEHDEKPAAGHHDRPSDGSPPHPNQIAGNQHTAPRPRASSAESPSQSEGADEEPRPVIRKPRREDPRLVLEQHGSLAPQGGHHARHPEDPRNAAYYHQAGYSPRPSPRHDPQPNPYSRYPYGTVPGEAYRHIPTGPYAPSAHYGHPQPVYGGYGYPGGVGTVSPYYEHPGVRRRGVSAAQHSPPDAQTRREASSDAEEASDMPSVVPAHPSTGLSPAVKRTEIQSVEGGHRPVDDIEMEHVESAAERRAGEARPAI